MVRQLHFGNDGSGTMPRMPIETMVRKLKVWFGNYGDLVRN